MAYESVFESHFLKNITNLLGQDYEIFANKCVRGK